MLIDLSPLKNRNFRNLFLGQTIASFGSQMTQITIPLQVYALTKSTFYTGLISAVELVFLIGAALLGGFFADTKEKRQLLLVSEAFLSLLVLGLALNASREHANLIFIFVMAAGASVLGGLHRPVLESVTPRIVPKEDLAKVSAILPLRTVLTMIVSPTIAGLCISHFGAKVTYLIDFVTLITSMIFLLRMPKLLPLKDSQDSKLSFFKSVLEGAGYVRKRQELFGSYLIDFIAMVFCMPHALFPAIADSYNKKEMVGFLYAAPAVGGMLITIFSKWTLGMHRHGRLIIFAAICWALSISTIGLAYSFHWVIVALLFAGLFDMISGIFRMTLWNQTIPDEFRGRLASFEMLSYSSGPLLGNAISGLLADSIGLHNGLLCGGLISCFLIIVSSFRLPKFWNYRSKYESLPSP